MKTIFAVFLLLPVTTGLRSFACSGTSDESVQHNLHCEAGERIKIISGQYGFKYSSDSCNRDCKYQSRQCDCRGGVYRTVETDLKNLCNGEKTCNFRIPKPYYTSCYRIIDNRRTYYRHYTYSYIEYECLTDFLRYSCTEKSDEHNIYCEEGERLNISYGQYGFSNESCSDHCQYWDSCECLLEFNSTVESNLKNSCNGLITCNFQPASPHSESCSTQYPYDYTHSYIVFGCLAVTTSTTRDQSTYGVTGQLYTDTSTIKSTKLDNSKPASSTDKASTQAVLNSTEINMAKTVNHNQNTPDTGFIVGIVMGCILLVVLVFIVIVFIFKRKTIETFIGNRFKDSARVSNPVYEAPSDGYNNVTFKNDNSPSVNVIELVDDYNHLHDIKNDNSMTTGNTYNHLGQMMGDYNYIHANNNGLHVDEYSDGAYNHLGHGMADDKTHDSDYNHLNGLNGTNNVSEEVNKANYNHLSGVNGEIPKADYNHPGENKTSKISIDDYNHIGDLTNETTDDDYHHIGNVTEHVFNDDNFNHIGDAKTVFNDDNYNHIGDAKHETTVEYELAHKGDLPVQDEQKPDNVQYEITDDERGDYSNISEQQSNYENFPISNHQTC